MKKILAGLMLATMLASGGLFAKGSKDASKAADANAPKKYRVILITMDSVNQYWLKMKKGAEDSTAELGNVELTFNAPPGKTDASVQLQMVEDAITKQVDAIMLCPLHADALVPGIDKAHKAGIKVVLLDSSANTENYDAFYATDNGAAARLAADTMAKLINNTGKIAIENAQAGAFTTGVRESEFKKQMADKYPNITIVGTQFDDGDKAKALNNGVDFMTANPDLAGFYTVSENSTLGIGEAVKQKGKSGDIKVVGFDWTDETKTLVEENAIQAVMVQNPYDMGYQGVKACVTLLTGGSVPRYTDTGVTIGTVQNADSIK
jgi:ribose transport system substrate-binding protein